MGKIRVIKLPLLGRYIGIIASTIKSQVSANFIKISSVPNYQDLYMSLKYIVTFGT